MTPFEPPAGRQVFSLAIAPRPDDIDVNDHVNNVVYLRRAQDIATAHWESRLDEGELAAWGWVALRHEIDYRRALTLDETAMARTWVGEHRGPRFVRLVRIDGPDGEMCAQVRSEWCLLDARTRRPARVPPWIAQRFD